MIPNRLVKHNELLKKSVKERKTFSEFTKEKALNVRKLKNPKNQSEIQHWLQTHELRSLLSFDKGGCVGYLDKNKGSLITDSKGVQVNVEQLAQRISSRTSVDHNAVEFNTESIPIQNVVVPNAINSSSQDNMMLETKKQFSHSTLVQN